MATYFDAHKDWLYVDWTGELTLPVVQAACAHIAHCFLPHPYPHVLNNNTQVTSIHWSVAPWLLRDLLPHLRLVGVKQLAWVCLPSLPGFGQAGEAAAVKQFGLEAQPETFGWRTASLTRSSGMVSRRSYVPPRRHQSRQFYVSTGRATWPGKASRRPGEANTSLLCPASLDHLMAKRAGWNQLPVAVTQFVATMPSKCLSATGHTL